MYIIIYTMIINCTFLLHDFCLTTSFTNHSPSQRNSGTIHIWYQEEFIDFRLSLHSIKTITLLDKFLWLIPNVTDPPCDWSPMWLIPHVTDPPCDWFPMWLIPLATDSPMWLIPHVTDPSCDWPPMLLIHILYVNDPYENRYLNSLYQTTDFSE